MILILLGAILEFGLPATNCTACTNERNNYMEQNNLVCDEYPSAYTRFCKQNANWAKQKFCQRSCFENGAGYDGDVCCARVSWHRVDCSLSSAGVRALGR